MFVEATTVPATLRGTSVRATMDRPGTRAVRSPHPTEVSPALSADHPLPLALVSVSRCYSGARWPVVVRWCELPRSGSR